MAKFIGQARSGGTVMITTIPLHIIESLELEYGDKLLVEMVKIPADVANKAEQEYRKKKTKFWSDILEEMDKL